MLLLLLSQVFTFTVDWCLSIVVELVKFNFILTGVLFHSFVHFEICVLDKIGVLVNWLVIFFLRTILFKRFSSETVE